MFIVIAVRCSRGWQNPSGFYFDYNSKSMSPQGSLGSLLEQIYEIRLEKNQPHKAISVETK
jgi:hypothetical protein